MAPVTRRAGTWADGGYNAGSDSTCFNGGTGNVNAGSSAALSLGPLANNGGPTQTIVPQAGSPVTGLIPDPTTSLAGAMPGDRSAWLCQRHGHQL